MQRFQFTLRTLPVLVSASMIAVYGWLYLHAHSTSNCGRNCAARAQVGGIAEALLLYSLDSTDGKFAIAAASAEQRSELANYARNSWTDDARYFVTSVPVDRNAERRVVAFCDRSYDNVPRYLVGRPPPSFAVSYSDGSTGLLGVEQFNNLDRSSSVALDELPVAIRFP